MLYRAYVAATGARIVGQCDLIPGTSSLDYFDARGEPLFAGGTNVAWDEQSADMRAGVTWWIDEDGMRYPASALVLRAVDHDDEIVAEIAPKPFPSVASRVRAERALALLREARDILKDIGAPRAVERVREAISSADGAVRAASARDNRPVVTAARADDNAA